MSDGRDVVYRGTVCGTNDDVGYDTECVAHMRVVQWTIKLYELDSVLVGDADACTDD